MKHSKLKYYESIGLVAAIAVHKFTYIMR